MHVIVGTALWNGVVVYYGYVMFMRCIMVLGAAPAVFKFIMIVVPSISYL